MTSESCQSVIQQTIQQGSQTHIADQVGGIYVLRNAPTSLAIFSTSHVIAHSSHLDGLYTGYTRHGLSWLPVDLELKDRTCLETVHSDGLISEDLDRRTSIACTSACNHPTRNNGPSCAISHSPSYILWFTICFYVPIHLCGNYKTPKMFTCPRYIQDTLVCNGIRRTQSVQTTQIKMQLLLEVFAKDALSVVHINTQPISTTSCPTHHMIQVNSSLLMHSHTTVLVTVGMCMLICSQTSLHDKCISCSPSLSSSQSSQPICPNYFTHTQIGSQMAQSLIARSKWIWKPDISQQNFENSAILLVIG